MKPISIKSALWSSAACCAALSGNPARAHDYFADVYAPAGYRQELNLQIPHGCKGSPIKEVHVQIPDDVFGVSVFFNRDWKIETKMRKLPKPVVSESGATVTETVGEIIWREPARVMPPSGMYDNFRFRAAMPDQPGHVLWFKAYQICEKGDDHYVDTPKETFTTDMPDFAAKFSAYYRGAAGPAPYIVLTKPDRPQSPLDSAKAPAMNMHDH